MVKSSSGVLEVKAGRVRRMIWGVPLLALIIGSLGSVLEPAGLLLSAAFWLGWTQGVGP